MLANVDCQIDVLVETGEESLPWKAQCGHPPANVRLLSWNDDVAQCLREGTYGLVICHTIRDLLFFAGFRNVPFVFVIHIALYSHSLKFLARWVIKRVVLEWFVRTRRCAIVAVSPFKCASWKVEKHQPQTIYLATLPVKTRRSRGGSLKIVTVGNGFAWRQELNNGLLTQIRQKLAVTVVGENPELEEAVTCSSREEYLALLADHDVFLYTTAHPWNDSYNTATLEAMASGLALASLRHPDSTEQFVGGGVFGVDASSLLAQLKTLQAKPEMARAMGSVNQRTIQERFSLEMFVERWTNLIRRVALGRSAQNVGTISNEGVVRDELER